MTEETPQVQVESGTYPAAVAVQDITALRDKVAELVPDIIPELLKTDSLANFMASIEESQKLFAKYAAAGTAATPATPAAATNPTTPPVTPAPVVPAGGVQFSEDLSKLPAFELIKRGLKARQTTT